MTKAFAVFRRELGSYFLSPTAYVLMSIFLFLAAFLFMAIISRVQEPNFQYILGNLIIVSILLTPVITMRLFAEEKQSGTLELLLTSPLREWEIVLGKYLAACSFFAIMAALTLLYPFIIMKFGKLDWGTLMAQYLGFLLAVFAFLAVGTFASYVGGSPVISAFLGFGMLLFLWILEWISGAVPPKVGSALSSLSLFQHYQGFSKGVIDTFDLAFYLSFTFFWLFITHQLLESRKWKQ
ncbi:MAG: ABC transporter permease subunit [Armatimonadetes bacterium]|nr:ABC transporter permease subunit [Armatimonadota bacterium]